MAKIQKKLLQSIANSIDNAVKQNNDRVQFEIPSANGPIKYNGHYKHMYMFLGVGVGTLFAWGGYKLLSHYFASKNAIRENDAASANKIKENECATDNEIRKDDAHTENEIKLDGARTDNEIKKMEAASLLRTQEFKERMTYRPKVAAVSQPTFDDFQAHLRELHSVMPMPDYSRIKVLKPFLDACPVERRPALLFTLLAAFGGLCFSKVRSKYLDGKMHAPNILVICEAESGAGKSDLKNVFDYLFERIILSDRNKMNSQQSNHIIQTVGIDFTKSKFMDILANNNGVHMVLFETEIVSVKANFRSQNGLNSSYLRNAFDNQAISKASSSKIATSGSYPVYMNCIFTGTPKAVSKLLNNDETEGGTARRFCLTTLPGAELRIPNIKLPSKRQCKIEKLREVIDDWRSRYVYTTSDEGQEIPCDEYSINLEYIDKVLDTWIKEQHKEAQRTNCKERSQFANAIATIAFHCAIVLHMLAGEPTKQNKEKRRTVKELTLYIANYCMESYLAKFVLSASTPDGSAPNYVAPSQKRELSPEELDYYYRLRGTKDEHGKEIGYGTIAKMVGMSKDDLRNALTSYEKRLGK